MRRRPSDNERRGVVALLMACLAVMGACAVLVSTHDLVPSLSRATSCVVGAGIIATSLLGMLTL